MPAKTTCRNGPPSRRPFLLWHEQRAHFQKAIAIIERVERDCGDERLAFPLNNMLDCLQRICDVSDRGMEAYHIRERAKRGLTRDGDV